MRTGEGAGDGPPGGGGLGGSPCSSKKASRSTYSTSPNGSVRSHSSGANRPGPGAAPGRPRGDPPPTTAPAGASAGPAVSRPGPGTVAAGGAALRSFSFRRPAGRGKTGWGGKEEMERPRHRKTGRKGEWVEIHTTEIQRKRGETGERERSERKGKDPEGGSDRDSRERKRPRERRHRRGGGRDREGDRDRETERDSESGGRMETQRGVR